MDLERKRKNVIKDCSAAPPTKVHMLSDGTTRTEKLCPIPLNKKMVDPAGNVVTVPLANGYTRVATAYTTYIEHEKLRLGFLPYGECPVATRRVTPVEGDGPCADADVNGRMPRGACCQHMNQIIAARRKVRKAKNDKFAARLTSSDAALKQAIVEQTKWMQSVAGQIQKPPDNAPFKTRKG